MKQTKRKHDPKWQDNTSNNRQSKRRAELEAAAKRDGFPSASAAITAWKNGDVVMVKAERRL